jgi:RNA polymerase sigma-70 factor (ECF subfamily)
MTQDEQMVRDVLDGKVESFRAIIERYQLPVHRMISNMINDHHAAEDITQEVFMAVFNKLSTFDPMRCRFSTWLFTIARNKSINHLRRNKKTLSLDSQEFVSSSDPSEQICNEEFFQQMDRALSALPKNQKRAFVLAEFEKLPYEEIAQIECVGIGTIKTRIHRAKKKLRKALTRTNGDER